MTPTLVHAVLGLALIVVVPLALRLDGRRRASWGLVASALAAGSPAGLSIVAVEDGVLAAAFAAPWLVLVILVALRHAIPVDPRALLRDAAEVLPFAYLVTGAGWLAVSRYGGRPLGFSDTIVELTAVHFHYAGFVAPVLVLRLVRWLHAHGAPDRAARLSLLAVLVARPLTAAGITFEPALGAAGAMSFAVGLTVTAVLTLRWVLPRTDGLGKVLLATPAPSLPVMVRTHGLLNAAGFGFAGTLGWLWEERRLGGAAIRRACRATRRGSSRGGPPQPRSRGRAARRALRRSGSRDRPGRTGRSSTSGSAEGREKGAPKGPPLRLLRC